ncbi:MAG: P63C domain-containing protein [Xanthomonadaceae bacterium]|nr:P63C domain-containing protein [Xanthomonadaceae bacterium]
MSDPKDPRSKGGKERAKRLSSDRRSEIAKAAAIARWDGDKPQATHEGEFELGGSLVSCAVLPNGQRVITQATFLRALGRSRSPKAGTGILASSDQQLPFFLNADVLHPFVSEELRMSTTPVFYRTKNGGKGVGYDARLLPQVADVYLSFRDAQLQEKGAVPKRYENIVRAADILMRGLANVGIIALVDEATGFQRDRAKDALARILEQFIADELRPWVRTFPDEFYEELFRLRKLEFPRDHMAVHKRPRYFGKLTNNIVYSRLAPGVLDELKRATPRAPNGGHKQHLHRRLTEEWGHPKLREHLASVITIMKLSENYDDFMRKLDRIHTRYGDTYDMLPEDIGD